MAKLIARKAGSTPLEYFVVEMTDVLVSSYSTGGSSGGGAAWAAEASWRAWGSDAGMGQQGIGAVGTEGERHV